MIKDLRRACDKLLLKPSKHRSLWCRPWCFITASASSTFWLSTRKSFLCQSGLLKGRRSACLSALIGWLLEHTEGLGNGAFAWCLLNPLIVPLTSTSWLLCHHSATQRALYLCFQFWQYKNLQQLARFEGCPKTDATVVGPLFRRWGLGTGERVPAASSPRSILTLKSTRTAIGARSLFFELGGSLFP